MVLAKGENYDDFEQAYNEEAKYIGRETAFARSVWMWDKMFLQDALAINDADFKYTKQQTSDMMDKRFKKKYTEQQRDDTE